MRDLIAAHPLTTALLLLAAAAIIGACIIGAIVVGDRDLDDPATAGVPVGMPAAPPRPAGHVGRHRPGVAPGTDAQRTGEIELVALPPEGWHGLRPAPKRAADDTEVIPAVTP